MKVLLFRDEDWLLSEDAFSIYAPCMYHPTLEDYEAQMEDYLLDPSVKVFVSENRGRKTGMMVLKSSEGAAEIIGIAVSDKARRKGIGKQLIQHVMKSENLESIKAQTDDDSIGFYRKCGFTEEKTIVEYPDGSAVRYNCVLNKKRNSRLSEYHLTGNREEDRMRSKSVTKRIVAALLLLVVVFGGINLFWYRFKYLPYKRLTEKMRLTGDSERPRYTGSENGYVFRLKMPAYLDFQSGFLYVVKESDEDAAAFLVDEDGNVTEKNVPHVDMFLWPQMFSGTQCRVTIYEETDSVWVMTDSRAEFIPNETLSDAENDRLSVLFEAHGSEIREMLKAAAGFWGAGLF